MNVFIGIDYLVTGTTEPGFQKREPTSSGGNTSSKAGDLGSRVGVVVGAGSH